MALSSRRAVAQQDRDLVSRVRAGDPTAFEELFRLYFAAMLRFAMSFVADPDAAEDIVQEILGRVWMQHATWTPPTDVLSYLLAAVRNRALDIVTTDHRRTTLTRLHGPTSALPQSSESADRAVERENHRDILWGVISALPEQRRTVLLLRWRYGLEWEEIAHTMGISVAAARMTHSRALQSLRDRLPHGFE